MCVWFDAYDAYDAYGQIKDKAKLPKNESPKNGLVKPFLRHTLGGRFERLNKPYAIMFSQLLFACSWR